jgi:TolA-binding protein
MMKKIVLALCLAFLIVFLPGCGGESAETLFETAKLEELQNNPEHARQLYREIIEKHSRSPYAKSAGERLNALEK